MNCLFSTGAIVFSYAIVFLSLISICRPPLHPVVAPALRYRRLK